VYDEEVMQRALLFLLAALVVGATEEPTYPEHGTVLSVRTLTAQHTTQLDSDASPGVLAGQRYVVDTFCYRIETADKIYEFRSSNNKLQMGDHLEFRIAKRNAYVRANRKEEKYAVTKIELKGNK
jgi:hypothetical protein